MAFENLSFDQLVAGTGRITWSENSLRVIYCFCAKKQISGHNLPSVEELAELLNLLHAPSSDPDAFQNVALVESKDATGQWTCLWLGWSKRWYKNVDWNGDISIPNDVTSSESRPREAVGQRHAMGTTSLLKALVKHQAQVIKNKKPVSGGSAEVQHDNGAQIAAENNAQILSLQVDKEALEKLNSDLKDKSAATISHLNNQITALKDHLNEPNSALDAEIVALKKQIMLDQAKAKTNLDRVAAEIANYKADKHMLAISMEAKDQQIETYNNEVAGYMAEKRVLTASIKAKDRQIETQQKQVQSLGSDVNALTVQISRLQAQLEQVSAGQYGPPGVPVEHIRLENAYNDNYPNITGIAKQAGDYFPENISPTSTASTVTSPAAPARVPSNMLAGYANLGMFSPTPQTPTRAPSVQPKINKHPVPQPKFADHFSYPNKLPTPSVVSDGDAWDAL
ncbi:hypothetical protein AC579_10319 [Pseudocercospora musae]|uniref:Uncharacterized protein n=1 Tax=Pseudocercospora musae TaxID=113226 RepID=A0A139H653_9PEZI|nr:hypothetical protein AC579_10319 [Pseudocercospora musae]